VFLNRAILGHTRVDIAARFERIVDFAGVRDFIDAPLRTYSSGMALRLGFAVATDVQPDVLVVDGILVVGDAEFHKRSPERIESFRKNGTTILMLSHNLVAVQAMCEQAMWLNHGEIQALGPAEEMVMRYQKEPA
jgi:ABC-type polysaccharide/polyol phosphate transport system ATPase subunit